MNDEVREFYENNKEMVDRIIAEQKQEVPREERFREDYLRALDAVDKLRDTMTGFVSEQSEYMDRFSRREYERFRVHQELEIERARARAAERRARMREEMLIARDRFSEDMDDAFGFLADPDFQRHVIGAGMEMFAAFNALIQSGPFPESFKSAARMGDLSRNTEFCRKNPDCRARRTADAEDAPAEKPRSVKINVTKKDDA